MQAAKRDELASDELASNGEQCAEPEWLNRTRLNHPHLADIAEQHGRMVEVAILAGDRERALHIIDRAFASLDEFPSNTEPPIGLLLGKRIASVLRHAGIETTSDLRQRTQQDLLAIKWISWDTVRKIISTLRKYGYKLKN